MIGVGGSNGKTTTKELLAAILAGAGPTLATRGNLNNHIGVPLTLLRLEPVAPIRGDRDGRQSPGRDRRARRGREARASRSSPTPATSTSRGSATSPASARAEGEMFAALDGRRHGRHQRRRPVRGDVAVDGAARRARPALRRRGDRRRARGGHRRPHRGRRLRHRVHARHRRRGWRGCGCRSPAATTCRTRSGRRPPPTPRASRCRRSSPASSACGPSPAACS